MALFKSKAKKKQEEILNRMRSLGAHLYIWGISHVYGLPVPENSDCNIFYGVNKITIDVNNSTFNLDRDKIVDIFINQEVDIQQHVVSSTGKAIAGGMLLGPVGAVIGGRAQTKTTADIEDYFIVSYKNEDELKQLAFSCYGTSGLIEIVEDFNKTKPARAEFNL